MSRFHRHSVPCLLVWSEPPLCCCRQAQSCMLCCCLTAFDPQREWELLRFNLPNPARVSSLGRNVGSGRIYVFIFIFIFLWRSDFMVSWSSYPRLVSEIETCRCRVSMVGESQITGVAHSRARIFSCLVLVVSVNSIHRLRSSHSFLSEDGM